MRKLFPMTLAAALAGACGGGGGATPTTRETWVASQLSVPTTSAQAQALGFDLDGDGTADNQLGSVFSALTQAAGSGGFDVQGGADAAVESGAVIQLVETEKGGTTSVAFLTGTPAVAPCTNPADLATCGHHLDGATHFTAGAPGGPALGGRETGTTISAGPGQVVLQVPLFGSQATALPLKLARASFTRSGATLQGKVGGAIPRNAVDTQVLPEFQVFIAGVVARDCPAGVCVVGSTGATMLTLFDTNGDGQVSMAELQANGLLATLLQPDVDTDGDRVPDALSVGFGYQLVGAVF